MTSIKEELLEAKNTYKRVGYALFFCVLMTFLFEIIIYIITYLLMKRGIDITNNDYYLWAITDIPLYFFGFTTFILVIRKTPIYYTKTSKLGFVNFLKYMLMCFPVMTVGSLIGTGLSSFLSNNTAINPLEEYLNGNFALRFLCVVILAPIFEELIFRKELIDHTNKYGERISIIFSGLAFGLFHMNLFQFIYAFALGCFFAYIYIKTHNIKYTIIMHMIINFLGSVVAPYVLSFDLELINGDMNALMNVDIVSIMIVELYILAFFVVNIWGLVLLIKNRKEFKECTNPTFIPKKLIFRTVYVNIGYVLFVLFSLLMSILSLYEIKIGPLLEKCLF